MKVLVCTDFSAASAAGEQEAARRFAGAELVLFHATDPALARRVAALTTLDAEAVRTEMARGADTRMSEVIAALTSEGKRAVAELVEGEPVAEAIAAAARHGVEVIVAGVPARSPSGAFRTRLARDARVPVLLVPA
jgi:universal stress protein family protein